MRIYVASIIILISVTAFAESYIDTTFISQEDKRINDIIEFEDVFILGGSIQVGTSYNSYLIKLGKNGIVIDDTIFASSSKIYRVFRCEDSIVVFWTGYNAISGRSYLAVTTLDKQFQVIQERFTSFPDGRYPSYFNVIRTKAFGYLVAGTSDITGSPPSQPGAFAIRVGYSGDSLNSIFMNPAYSPSFRCHGSINIQDDYLLYTSFLPTSGSYGSIISIDSSFLIKDTFNIEGQLYDLYSPTTVDDSLILLLTRKHGSDNVFLSKTSRTGTIIVSKAIGKPSHLNYPAYQNSVAYDKGHLYFVMNEDFALSSPFLGAGAPSYITIGRLNSQLDTLWTRSFGGDAYYFVYNIKTTSDGGCIVVGTFNDTINHGNKRDIFIKQFDSMGVCTSTTHYLPVDQKIRVYPNPTSQKITIQKVDDTDFIVCVDIYNLSGALIKSIGTSTNNLNFDISDIVDGTYLICGSTKSGHQFRKKIIKAH